MENLNGLGNIDIFTPTSSENAVLERLDGTGEYVKFSEMSGEERQFLNGLILRNKPQKLLELGVSSGGSTVVMLNALHRGGGALYSIDYLPWWYKNKKLKTGFAVDEYPHLKEQWKLFSGGLALKFMDAIGGDIDFCLIDTMHTNPGEILDFLMVLPWLKDDAIVVFHDTSLHTAGKMFQWHVTNNLLMSAIVGNKILQGNFNEKTAWANCAFPNIGAIRINESTRENLYALFNLLTIKWYYLPSRTEQFEILEFFGKYYNACFVDKLRKIFDYHNHNFHKYQGIRHKLKETAKRMPIAWKIMDMFHR
ncbi:MAG: class I SAM-dependent methyltransferase [Bacteroidales bacterium]|jgi:predicted O-methyltransferase YrrM|nr:class I SAM-dependent methyltransferase [Bacteroidales bacterium]